MPRGASRRWGHPEWEKWFRMENGRIPKGKEITPLPKIQARSLPASQVSQPGILKEKENFLLPGA